MKRKIVPDSNETVSRPLTCQSDRPDLHALPSVICEYTLSARDVMERQAEALGFDAAAEGSIRPEHGFTHILYLHQGCLSLRLNRQQAPSPTTVDFTDAALQYRRRTSGKSQGIGRAVGLKKQNNPIVLDATAGLGRDSFILACLGCRVLMLERSPIMHALLEDGLMRARSDAGLAAIVSKLSLRQIDAIQWCQLPLQDRAMTPDVIYLDPMFPAREKSARVKKDISLLQSLLGVDEDITSLLSHSRNLALRRVVLKRPGKPSSKVEPAPDFQATGKSCHFDIYLCSKGQ